MMDKVKFLYRVGCLDEFNAVVVQSKFTNILLVLMQPVKNSFRCVMLKIGFVVL